MKEKNFSAVQESYAKEVFNAKGYPIPTPGTSAYNYWVNNTMDLSIRKLPTTVKSELEKKLGRDLPENGTLGDVLSQLEVAVA